MTTREKILNTQLKRLLAGLSGHGVLHLAEVETDLVQTIFLLGEAIEKLGASFMAIHDSVCAQQKLVDEIIDATAISPELNEKLTTVKGEIARNINAAVTGLQFQDMTNQLVARTINCVNGLRDVLISLDSNSAGLTPEIEAEAVHAVLENLNKLIEDHGAKLKSGLWKPVHQTHMESGDIELF